MDNKILIINNLVKKYDQEVLKHINFEIDKGQFIAIMGTSGSGKTTLLNCISSIDKPTSGDIIINNNNISTYSEKKLATYRAQELGFIFQDFNLINNLTAYENIVLSLVIAKKKQLIKNIKVLAEKFDVINVLNSYPYQLSGGQKQRIAAIRALIKEPSLILADEPTGSLDSKNAKALMQTIVKIQKEQKATILMVTHDPVTASYADEVYFMQDGKFIKTIKCQDSQQDFLTTIIDTNKNIEENNVL